MPGNESGRNLGVHDERDIRELHPVEPFKEISGGFHIKLDHANRVTVPASFRWVLGDGKNVKLFPWLNGTFAVSTLPVFTRLKEEAASGPLSHLSPEDVNLLFGLNAIHTSIDHQRRMLIPSGLRAYAGLQSEGVAVGRGDYIEYWNIDRLTRHYQRISEAVKDIMPGLPMFSAERQDRQIKTP